MLKQICKQLWNRKRSNVWILIELLLVFCILWYIVDYFFVLGYNHTLPTHRNLDHTWQVNMAVLPEGHAEFIAEENEPEALKANYNRVLDRILQAEGVEALTVLNSMSSPGSGNFNGNNFRNKQDTARKGGGQIIAFDTKTDFFKVFRYTTTDGKPVSTRDFDWADPKTIVIGQSTADVFFPGESGLGKILVNAEDSTSEYVVRGIVGDIKRFDYTRPQKAFYISFKKSADRLGEEEIAIRSNESLADTRFLSAFKERMEQELRIGNFYLKSVIPYNKINSDTETEFGMTNEYRVRMALAFFFLINIMLCVMGTFWYRIRARRDEIGIRMVMGSTRFGIRKLLFAEGLCLLLFITIPALLLESQFINADLLDTLGQTKVEPSVYLPDRTIVRFILTNILTWIILAVTIIAAVWLPAGKASKMAPADALHYE